jgi:hypothetical protein
MPNEKHTIQTVSDIPENFALLSDSQDIQACLDHIGASNRAHEFGCLFAEILEADYGRVYGCETAVPRLGAMVEQIHIFAD